MKCAGMLIVFSALLGAQTTSTNSPTQGSVAGKVINAVTGEPVRRASIMLRATSTEEPSYAAEAGADGRFRIDGMQPGNYLPSASKIGYLFKQPGPDGAPAATTKIDAGSLVEVVIRLVPTGVISGRVTDQDGDPIQSAAVEVVRRSFSSGTMREVPVGPRASTNEKGEYRISGVNPGTVLVRVNPVNYMRPQFPSEPLRGPRPALAYRLTYFPSALDAVHATSVKVEAGAVRAGVDLQVRRESTYVIRIPLTDITEKGVAYTPSLMTRENTPIASRTSFSSSGMLLNNVSPGSYIVKVVRGSPNQPRQYASVAVDVVNADVSLGALNFAPGIDLPVTVKIASDAPFDRKAARVILSSENAREGQGASTVPENGTFTLGNLSPDFHRVSVIMGDNPRFYVKSIRFGDTEAPDRRIDLSRGAVPLTIVLASDSGTISGVVKNAAGAPTPRARLTLLDSKNEGLGRAVFTDAEGHFEVKNVPPNDYRLFAWENVAGDLLEDPEFRKRFEKRGIAVKLPPNGDVQVEASAVPASETQNSQ